MKPTAAPKHDSRLATELAAFCKNAVSQPQQRRDSFPTSPLWAAAARTGTALWLDTGDVDAARALWTRDFQALTTNNTLLNNHHLSHLTSGLSAAAAAAEASLSPSSSSSSSLSESTTPVTAATCDAETDVTADDV
jgi:hypothetical protein